MTPHRALSLPAAWVWGEALALKTPHSVSQVSEPVAPWDD